MSIAAFIHWPYIWFPLHRFNIQFKIQVSIDTLIRRKEMSLFFKNIVKSRRYTNSQTRNNFQYAIPIFVLCGDRTRNTKRSNQSLSQQPLCQRNKLLHGDSSFAKKAANHVNSVLFELVDLIKNIRYYLSRYKLPNILPTI